jgi:anti-sigma regulatory factor (Ser/Thr protein kinase)
VSARLELAVDGAPGALGAAQAELERWLEGRELDPRSAYRAQLVFEEIATNILAYGWRDAADAVRRLDFTLEVEPEHLRLRFRDRGAAFDPVSAPPPERAASIAEAKVGGLGLDLVRKAAAAIDYRREAGENRTEVRIAR